MTLDDAQIATLVAAAREASDRAHAPYSRFHVGAALLTSDGQLFKGCNVENASYGATVCAERNAVGSMVAAGGGKIIAVAVFTDTPKPVMPCGICRQVLVEFAQDTLVISATPTQECRLALGDLLPEPFVFGD